MRAKKGMSPLIATVLLIAFAVALGAMIMNWTSDFEPPPVGSDDPCYDVSIELNQVFGKEIFCYENDMIRFNIVNSGQKPIEGIQVRTVNENLQQVQQDLEASSLKVGESLEKEIDFDKSGKVHVELVPRMHAEEGAHYCINKRIVKDVLSECKG